MQVADFGVSKKLDNGDQTAIHTILGNQKYKCPQIMYLIGSNIDDQSQLTAGYNGKLSDVFSLGVMCYELAVFDLPFTTRELMAERQPEWGIEQRCHNARLSHPIVRFLVPMLQWKARERPWFYQIEEQWF